MCVCVYIYTHRVNWATLVFQSVKNLPAMQEIPRSGRSPEEGNGNPLQYYCLENPMDGGAWWAAVHGVARSWTQLSDFTLFLGAPKSLQMVIAAMKLKDAYSMEGKL